MNGRVLLALSVAAGSALGGVARWLAGTWIQQRVATPFPVGTLAVNVSGAMLLGFLVRTALVSPAVKPEIQLLLATGFCGGYTTFSTFSLETAVMLEQGQYGRAAAYALASVLLTVIAMFAGFLLARVLLLPRGRA